MVPCHTHTTLLSEDDDINGSGSGGIEDEVDTATKEDDIVEFNSSFTCRIFFDTGSSSCCNLEACKVDGQRIMQVWAIISSFKLLVTTFFISTN
jgi:hypothetical protein